MVCRILCSCTQLHARTQRVSEYIHEYVYAYVFLFVCACACVLNVQCVCRCTCMCLCLYDVKYVLCVMCMWSFCSSFCHYYCLLQMFAFRFLCFDFRFCCDGVCIFVYFTTSSPSLSPHILSLAHAHHLENAARAPYRYWKRFPLLILILATDVVCHNRSRPSLDPRAFSRLLLDPSG